MILIHMIISSGFAWSTKKNGFGQRFLTFNHGNTCKKLLQATVTCLRHQMERRGWQCCSLLHHNSFAFILLSHFPCVNVRILPWPTPALLISATTEETAKREGCLVLFHCIFTLDRCHLALFLFLLIYCSQWCVCSVCQRCFLPCQSGLPKVNSKLGFLSSWWSSMIPQNSRTMW